MKLLLIGDTNLQGRNHPEAAFDQIAPLLEGADFRFAQLEGPIVSDPALRTPGTIPHKPLWRHGAPEMVKGLTAARLDAVSLASNVTYPRDVGPMTVAALTEAGIQSCGAGDNLDAARAPAIVEKQGKRVGFLSRCSVFWPYGHAAEADKPGIAAARAHTAYRPGPRTPEMPGAPPEVETWPDPEDLAQVCEDVAALRSQVDFLVLSWHWGVSSSESTCAYQRAYARTAIAAGADLIFGHHPHVIQGAEVMDGKPVFYSVGNAVFDWQKMRGRHLDGVAVEVDLETRGCRLHPIQRDAQNEIAMPQPAASREILERFRRLSRELGTPDTVIDAWTG